MINVEGFRAFRGTMRITPVKSSGIEPFEITGDWLYKPEYKCWYGNGRSYPAEICEVVRDDADIVHCGECRFKDTEDCPMSECVESTPSNGFVWKTDHKAQYCSYGKAKEGDDGK